MSDQTAESLKSPVVTPLQVTQRLAREKRWKEAEPVRDAMMRECRQKGMTKEQAQEWTYAELDRIYPPIATPIETAVQVVEEQGDSNSQSDGGSPAAEPALAHAREGIGRLPRSWPPLADNAPLAVELGWVQANRLRIVEERPSGPPIVRLKRAGSPAPSWAALGWLDTAIRNPAKWADLCAKGMAQQELESDLTKRERRSIEDVRALLAEMRGK